MEKEQPSKLELNVIDYFCTFSYLLNYIGVDFPNRSIACFCPFHDNYKTTAAKLYCEDHNEHIFCFAENKQYKPHHLLTKGIVPFTVNHVFSAIWQNLSDSEKDIFSSDLKFHRVENNFSKQYNDYKKGIIDYFTLLSILKN